MMMNGGTSRREEADRRQESSNVVGYCFLISPETFLDPLASSHLRISRHCPREADRTHRARRGERDRGDRRRHRMSLQRDSVTEVRQIPITTQHVSL